MMLKMFGLGLAGLAALVMVAAVLLMGWRGYQQAQVTRRLELTGGQAIAWAGYVRIGGVDQWIQIRGEDRRNPVILVLHGGPGGTMIPRSYEDDRNWERDFTVVHWDQRGGGRTWLRGEDPAITPTIDLITTDGIEVTEFVRRRLGAPKVVLVGHSWGTILGLEMARRRPDLFYAYVGTGQVVNMRANETVGYARLVERVRAEGATADLARLEALGPPPYADLNTLGVERGILMRHPPRGERDLQVRTLRAMFRAPGYGLSDIWRLSTKQPDPRLWREVMAYDAAERGLTFRIPVFIVQGAEDIQTPTELVHPFFEALVAPTKEMVTVPDVGHMLALVRGDVLLGEIKRLVLPVVRREIRVGVVSG